jgi:hypothetical protein
MTIDDRNEPFLRKARRLGFMVVVGRVPCAAGPVVASGRICVETEVPSTSALAAAAPDEGKSMLFLATLRL